MEFGCESIYERCEQFVLGSFAWPKRPTGYDDYPPTCRYLNFSKHMECQDRPCIQFRQVKIKNRYSRYTSKNRGDKFHDGTNDWSQSIPRNRSIEPFNRPNPLRYQFRGLFPSKTNHSLDQLRWKRFVGQIGLICCPTYHPTYSVSQRLLKF